MDFRIERVQGSSVCYLSFCDGLRPKELDGFNNNKSSTFESSLTLELKNFLRRCAGYEPPVWHDNFWRLQQTWYHNSCHCSIGHHLSLRVG